MFKYFYFVKVKIKLMNCFLNMCFCSFYILLNWLLSNHFYVVLHVDRTSGWFHQYNLCQFHSTGCSKRHRWCQIFLAHHLTRGTWSYFYFWKYFNFRQISSVNFGTLLHISHPFCWWKAQLWSRQQEEDNSYVCQEL